MGRLVKQLSRLARLAALRMDVNTAKLKGPLRTVAEGCSRADKGFSIINVGTSMAVTTIFKGR